MTRVMTTRKAQVNALYDASRRCQSSERTTKKRKKETTADRGEGKRRKGDEEMFDEERMTQLSDDQREHIISRLSAQSCAIVKLIESMTKHVASKTIDSEAFLLGSTFDGDANVVIDETIWEQLRGITCKLIETGKAELKASKNVTSSMKTDEERRSRVGDVIANAFADDIDKLRKTDPVFKGSAGDMKLLVDAISSNVDVFDDLCVRVGDNTFAKTTQRS